MKLVFLLSFRCGGVRRRFSGVFDAGWSTAYVGQDSLAKMHVRLHSPRNAGSDSAMQRDSERHAPLL